MIASIIEMEKGEKEENKASLYITRRIIFFSPSSMTRNGATAAARPPSFLEPRSACHIDKLCAFQFPPKRVRHRAKISIQLLRWSATKPHEYVKSMCREPHTGKAIARNPCIEGKHTEWDRLQKTQNKGETYLRTRQKVRVHIPVFLARFLGKPGTQAHTP